MLKNMVPEKHGIYMGLKQQKQPVIWLVVKLLIKITSASKKSAKTLPNDETEEDVERATHKKRYISPEEKQEIIDELRSV